MLKQVTISANYSLSHLEEDEDEEEEKVEKVEKVEKEEEKEKEKEELDGSMYDVTVNVQYNKIEKELLEKVYSKANLSEDGVTEDYTEADVREICNDIYRHELRQCLSEENTLDGLEHLRVLLEPFGLLKDFDKVMGRWYLSILCSYDIFYLVHELVSTTPTATTKTYELIKEIRAKALDRWSMEQRV
jgi:hypothetical protein